MPFTTAWPASERAVEQIIERARQEHLLGNLLASSTSITKELVDEVQSAFDAFFAKNLGQLIGGMSYADVARRLKTDTSWRKELIVQEEKSGMWLDALSTSAAAISKAQDALASGKQTTKEDAAALIDASTDPLAKHLDKLHGATITDPSLSQTLARKWEASFFDDMSQLGVERPDSLTRVTEFLDEIVAFVQRIVDNGFAYEAGGSVYFDVAKFDGAKGGAATKGKAKAESSWQHCYAKLQPGSKANLALLNSGEGALSSHKGKRSSADFALWKASKPGEPAWPSPWGDGRPGWHIECSVMASAILGDGMDIHSGGVDLMFPHHDNEMAQSEVRMPASDRVL